MREVRTTELKPGPKCPSCSEVLDAASSLEDEAPKAGDFSLCLYCAATLRFTEALELVPASDADAERELPPAAWSDFAAIKAALKRRVALRGSRHE